MLENGEGNKCQIGDTEDFTFDSTATHLGIPRENWEQQPVREFVGLYNRVQQLQLDLSAASATHLRKSSVGGLFGTPAEDLAQENQAVGEMNPSLATRYGSAELLMRASMELLADGFRGNRAHPNYIKSKLNAAINGLGLDVIDSPKRERR